MNNEFKTIGAALNGAAGAPNGSVLIRRVYSRWDRKTGPTPADSHYAWEDPARVGEDDSPTGVGWHSQMVGS